MRFYSFVVACCVVGTVATTKTVAAKTMATTHLERFQAAFVFVTDFVRRRHSTAQVPVLQKGLSVIGAGFSRTGTKSMEEALSRHLGHQIYDLRSILQHGHGPRWVAAARAWRKDNNLKPMDELLQEIEFQGYTATLDFPVNLFAIPLSELRPEAKVIFSVRDSPEKWVQAWAHINKVLGNLSQRPWNWLVPDLWFTKHAMKEAYDFDWRVAEFPHDIDRPLPWFEIIHTNPQLDSPKGQAEWIEFHEYFHSDLEEHIAADRLLVYNVREGWAPWVDFLNLDDSLRNLEFPHVNDCRSIEMVRNVLDVVAVGFPLWIALFVWGVRKFGRFLCDRLRKVKKL